MNTYLKLPVENKVMLKEVYSLAKSRHLKLFLVGGVLRDHILGRQKKNPDFDFTLKSDSLKFGKLLAIKMKAGFVILDKERYACRVVKKSEGRFYTFDFTDYRGKTLEEDLLHRDFTINSMALALENVFVDQNPYNHLIDFYGARVDLKAKVIRVVNSKSFQEDPLRILRAFSFSSLLGFEIEKNTLKLAKLEKSKIAKVSFERIRDELFKIFDSDKSASCFTLLDKLKILECIFPEINKMRKIGQGPYHHLDVWQHTLETMRQLENLLLLIKDKEIQEYLDEVISADRQRRQLLKLGAFLHDFGKPKTLRREKGRTTFHGHERVGLDLAENIARRLKLSNDEVYSLHKMVLWHLRPGYLADSQRPSARAKFRYFRDTAKEALSILILSLADQRATKGPLTTSKARQQHETVVASLIKEYLSKNKEVKKARLINGNIIMKKFGLDPSPLVGKVLSEIEELQAIGKIKTSREALLAAAKFIKKAK